MKFVSFVLSALVLSSAPLALAQEPANMDFELNARPGQLPSGWLPVGSGYAAYTVRGGAVTGAFSVGFSQAQQIATFGGIGQCVSAAAYLNRTVLFDGAIKTYAVNNGYAGLWLRVDGPNGTEISLDNMSDRPIYGTTEWDRYSISTDIPSYATNICFGALLTGTGSAFADDLHLNAFSFGF